MASETGPALLDGPDQATPKAKRSLQPTLPLMRDSSRETSRESSPARSLPRGVAARPRRNSRDVSPAKPSSLTSSLSSTPKTPAQTIQSFPPPLPQPDTSSEATPRASRRSDNPPRWPTPQRLRSPPPSTVHRSQAGLRKQNDSNTASRSPSRADSNGGIQSIDSITHPTDTESEDGLSTSSGRVASRGVSGTGPSLQTVPETGAMASNLPRTASAPTVIDEKPIKTSELLTHSKLSNALESGSESGENKSERHIDAAIRPLTKINTVGRSRPADQGTNQSMTVETETVLSIPQAALGTIDRSGGRSDTGSLRMKSSRETIRPKKEKKKPVRKAPPVTSGVASTKADIFEAQIASAVDDADSTDSEETFVYESNPPDQANRSSRQHSRTPSATSLQMYLDQRGGRSNGGRNDTLQNGGKKSMKFTNTYNSTGTDSGAGDRGEGTGRGSGRGNGTVGSQHHHHGQNGRGGRTPHKSLFAEDTPFNQAKRPAAPGSPRSGIRNGGTTPTAIKKMSRFNTYDLSGEGADDERTPLMGHGRVRRNRRTGSSSLRRLEDQGRGPRSWLARYLGCILLSIMVSIVMMGAVTFLFATTKPLVDVSILEIKNVLASEQELVLDLVVEATNFNVIAVNIYNMEIGVWAKSKHVPKEGEGDDDGDGSGDEPEPILIAHRSIDLRDSSLKAKDASNGVDEGTDPIPDPPKPVPNLLLGHVTDFDNPLTFEGTPFRRLPNISIGEIRVGHPGNKTEDNGTERWEALLQHPFELIVRGTLKYQLPLSSRVKSPIVSGSVTVHPEDSIKVI